MIGSGANLTNLPAAQLTGTLAINTTGNAATATKATNDSAGNNISTFYYPTSNPSVFLSTVPVTATNRFATTNGYTQFPFLPQPAASVLTNLANGNGSGLTNLLASQLTGALPALDGSALTNLTASALTGTVSNATLAQTAVTATAAGSAAVVTGGQSNTIASALQSVPATATNQFTRTNDITWFDSKGAALNATSGLPAVVWTLGNIAGLSSNTVIAEAGAAIAGSNYLTAVPATYALKTDATNAAIGAVNSGQTAAVTNNASGVTLSGSFTGNGSGLTNLNGGTLTGSVLNTTNGKVGIGTTTPSANLDIYKGDSGDSLTLSGDQAYDRYVRILKGTTGSIGYKGGYLRYDTTANNFVIGIHLAQNSEISNDVPAIIIPRQTGYVGINMTPVYPLDVTGIARVSSDLNVGGIISGNGSGLTNLNAATATTANQVLTVSNLTYIYQPAAGLYATSTVSVYDPGILLPAGSYQFNSVALCASKTNIGVYCDLLISNTAAIGNGAASFQSYGDGAAMTTNTDFASTESSLAYAMGQSISAVHYSLYAGGRPSSDVSSSGTSSGWFNLTAPSFIRWECHSWSGANAFAPSFVSTNSTAIFRKIN